MGTTLTGTTPQDTYESLIKVADNGPLSATAKFLSDGEGTDSVLALSTTKVGINTSTPDANLHISGDVNNRALLRLASTAANRMAAVTFFGNNVESAVIGYEGGSEVVSGGVQGDFIIRNLLAGKDIILDTNAGNVGIGTNAPEQLLELSSSSATGGQLLIESTAAVAGDFAGMRFKIAGGTDGGFQKAGIFAQRGSGGFQDLSLAFAINNVNDSANVSISDTRIRIDADGLKFGSDTAAANALDDYEEGTWTMGVAFGGASVDVTTSANTGTYTKIGRQVTVNGLLALTSKGSSSGDATITGLPFTIANSNANFSAASLLFLNISFANQLQAQATINTTKLELQETTDAGVATLTTNADFADNSVIILSLTYFV